MCCSSGDTSALVQTCSPLDMVKTAQEGQSPPRDVSDGRQEGVTLQLPSHGESTGPHCSPTDTGVPKSAGEDSPPCSEERRQRLFSIPQPAQHIRNREHSNVAASNVTRAALRATERDPGVQGWRPAWLGHPHCQKLWARSGSTASWGAWPWPALATGQGIPSWCAACPPRRCHNMPQNYWGAGCLKA